MTGHPGGGILPGMAKVKMTVWGWRCERCAHEWLPRNTTQDPKVCPKCKSPYWNTPRRSQATASKGHRSKGATK